MDALAKHLNPTRIGNRHPSISPFDAYTCKDRMLVIYDSSPPAMVPPALDKNGATLRKEFKAP